MFTAVPEGDCNAALGTALHGVCGADYVPKVYELWDDVNCLLVFRLRPENTEEIGVQEVAPTGACPMLMSISEETQPTGWCRFRRKSTPPLNRDT